MSSAKSAAARQMEALGLEWDYELTPETGLTEAEVSGETDEKAWGTQGKVTIPGLTKCLGVAVYDRSSGEGYATHFTTHGKNNAEIAETLREFDSALMAHGVDFENSEAAVAGANYSVEVSGGILDEDQSLEEIGTGGSIRGIAEYYVDQKFGESNAYWDMDDGYTGEITMDIDEGVITYDPASQPIHETLEETV